jgi:hypothetical protein
VVFTDTAFKYFSLIQSNVRAEIGKTSSDVPYQYNGEQFFQAYEVIRRIWRKRQSQRNISTAFNVHRTIIKKWETNFVHHGVMGLLQLPPFLKVDPRLEGLVVLVKRARPHAGSSNILTLAQALNIPDATIEIIRRIQRSYGYGQRQDKNDVEFYNNLQKIIESITHYHPSPEETIRDIRRRFETFFNYDQDPFQQRIELFKELSAITRKRQILPVLQKFGIHSSRFYVLKQRYMRYGVWGLVDLVHSSRRQGE